MVTDEDNQQAVFIPDGHIRPTPKKGVKTQRCPLYKLAIYASLCLHIAVIVLVITSRFGQPYTSEPSHVSSAPWKQWCPDDSILYKRKCYYFSAEESNWTSSQNTCSSRKASLARIEEEEKNFVKLNMDNQPFWIGLRKHPSQPWKWLDGEKATMKVIGEGGDCAYLHDIEKMEASSSRCSTEHRFICKSEEPQN